MGCRTTGVCSVNLPVHCCDRVNGPRSSFRPPLPMSGGGSVPGGTRCCRPSGDIEPIQDVLQQILGLGPEESLRGRRAVGPTDQVVVEDRQHLQLARAELMQVVMTQSELSVPSLYAGAGT